MRRPLVSLLALVLVAGAGAQAQEPTPAVVSCVSAAAAEGPAATAEFTIRYAYEAETAVDTLAGAATFDENLRTSLALKELKGLEIRVDPPLLSRYTPPRAEVNAVVRANLNALTGDSGPQMGFAMLIDELARISETLKCTVSLPHFLPGDEAGLISQAVRAATESAFAPADAAAAALRARVYTVDQIDVLGHGFDRPEEPVAGWHEPGPRTVSCWARVKVTYILADE